MYTVLAGATGALYGPLHGGANEAVLRMLTDIGSVDNIPAFIQGVKNRWGPGGEGRHPDLIGVVEGGWQEAQNVRVWAPRVQKLRPQSEGHPRIGRRSFFYRREGPPHRGEAKGIQPGLDLQGLKFYGQGI